MMAVTKSLSSDVHQVRKNGQTEKLQVVPQIVSTLRLDLVFWSNLLSDQQGELKKYRDYNFIILH